MRLGASHLGAQEPKKIKECDFRGCALINSMAEIPCPDNQMRKEIAKHKRGLLRRLEELVLDH